jgi:hypothetical protein
MQTDDSVFEHWLCLGLAALIGITGFALLAVNVARWLANA